MVNQVEMMDKRRRKLLTINLVFIFVYLIVMLWEFMSVQQPGYPYHRIVISKDGQLIIEDSNLIIMNDLKEHIKLLENSMDLLKNEKDAINKLREESLQNIDKLKEQLEEDKIDEIQSKVENQFDIAQNELENATKEINEKLGDNPEIITGTITNNIETPHFFWVVLLVLQIPMSIVLYNVSKKIKKDPVLDSALNNELVQFNRLKAWRTAFFTSIIALFVLAILQYQSYFGMGWVAAFTACIGFAAYLIKFLKLDKEGEYGE